jgi:hypothetical protein
MRLAVHVAFMEEMRDAYKQKKVLTGFIWLRVRSTGGLCKFYVP